ncbi:MAG: magnesium-translocating P-type ATPase [Burkholderiaceae bacterium]
MSFDPSERPDTDAWWQQDSAALLAALGSGPGGLGSAQARQAAQRSGPNLVVEAPAATLWHLLWRQFSSPLVLILVVGALISLFIGDWIEASTILAIVLGSTVLGFVQEARAGTAVAELRSRLALSCQVRRDGRVARLPASALVPGDVVELSAGNLVPADGRVLEARDFLVTEASLTGESFPVEKQPGTVRADAPLRERTNCVFLGSSVRSGTATVLVTRTGRATAMGDVAARLAAREEETEFSRGVRHFGGLLMRVMMVVVVAVLVVNQALGRPMIDSLLFAVALAVGLSPELLPAIVSVLLARGTRRLAGRGVLVRRLDAIENLGSMDVLCTDKTGTLTGGVLALDGALDTAGQPSADVLRWAFLNAHFETGIDNPLDQALVAAGEQAGLGAAGWRKVDEIPYDFSRRRLAIALAPEGGDDAAHHLVVKGAFDQTLAVCSHWRQGGQAVPLADADRQRLGAFVQTQGGQGLRVLAVATRALPARERYTVADEAGMTLEGFACFTDPPKPGAAEAVAQLAAMGVTVKMVTGDNRHVAAHLAAQVGLDPAALLTGEAIAALNDEALWHLAERTALFVEVDPAQKERIVRALQRTGHAVGYLGDGINDAPALHAADVGISVDDAVDVARESADVVLLKPDLGSIRQGVEDGRRTFANTLKYISITTSANFGNMVSMALATPVLPFLPMTAAQILLNNFLSDLPAMALSTDRVDAEHLQSPQRWDVAQVRRFMLVFGLVSSVFDLLTFAALLRVFHAAEGEFRTAWFLASLLTELGVVLVLRTRLPAWQSRPGTLLLWSTAAVFATACALPYLPPLARTLALQGLPPTMWLALLAIVASYLGVTEGVKLLLQRRAGRLSGSARPAAARAVR